jgi:hypothetical protein
MAVTLEDGRAQFPALQSGQDFGRTALGGCLTAGAQNFGGSEHFDDVSAKTAFDDLQAGFPRESAQAGENSILAQARRQGQGALGDTQGATSAEARVSQEVIVEGAFAGREPQAGHKMVLDPGTHAGPVEFFWHGDFGKISSAETKMAASRRPVALSSTF